MRPELNREFREEKGFPFPVLTDERNRVAERFGLVFSLPEELRNVYQAYGVDLRVVNGDDTWTLPMPARYLVDTAGRVRWASVDPDYMFRPEPEVTLEALDALLRA